MGCCDRRVLPLPAPSRSMRLRLRRAAERSALGPRGPGAVSARGGVCVWRCPRGAVSACGGAPTRQCPHVAVSACGGVRVWRWRCPRVAVPPRGGAPTRRCPRAAEPHIDAAERGEAPVRGLGRSPGSGSGADAPARGLGRSPGSGSGADAPVRGLGRSPSFGKGRGGEQPAAGVTTRRTSAGRGQRQQIVVHWGHWPRRHRGRPPQRPPQLPPHRGPQRGPQRWWRVRLRPVCPGQGARWARSRGPQGERR